MYELSDLEDTAPSAMPPHYQAYIDGLEMAVARRVEIERRRLDAEPDSESVKLRLHHAEAAYRRINDPRFRESVAEWAEAVDGLAGRWIAHAIYEESGGTQSYVLAVDLDRTKVSF
jgi:hypothetical protein